MIEKKNYPISASGFTRAGIAIFPDDFTTNPERCPLIFFFHGTGQAGDGTLGPVEKLYDNGSPLAQARDGKLKTITCPITGKVYRPVVWGLQGVGAGGDFPWCVRPADALYALNQFLKANPQIDPSMIMVTGLSAGGETTIELLGGPGASLFLAGWPMSTPSIDTSIVDWFAVKAKMWFTHGKLDGGQTSVDNSIRYVNALNAAIPGQAFLTLTNDGHGGWDKLYDPAFRIVMPGVANGKAINGYEFLCACKNSIVKFTASGTDAGTGGTNPPSQMATQAKAAATLNADGTITISPAGTTGPFTSWFWSYIIPAGAEKPWFSDGRSDGGATLFDKIMQNIKPGNWSFTLHVINGNTESVSTVTVQVGTGSGTVTPPAVVKTVKNCSTQVVNGLIVVTIGFSDGTTQVIQ